MFIHLRAHSYYSFLEAISSPAELAQAAARDGMKALGLADHQGLVGAVEFYDACRGLDVMPLHGLELDVAPLPGVLVLYAMDMDGWRSLCRLSSAANGGEPSTIAGPLPLSRLSEDTTGLLCLTGGRLSPIAGLLREGRLKTAETYLGGLAELFPGRLYAELQSHSPADRGWVEDLANMAHKLGLPCVATHSLLALEPGKEEQLRLMAAIRLVKQVKELKEEQLPLPEARFLNAREMAERFTGYPDAINATQEVAERCRLDLPLGKPHFPELPMPDGSTPIQLLRQKAVQGAERLYGTGEGKATWEKRLDHELSVIEQCGYASLFLVMEEILGFARRKGVPVSSRGSAASSLVAHCLGITSPDPLRLNLYFERFLNPARATPPDIDTDLCSRRRDAVIRFVYERYGMDRVAMVCTISRFRRRSALREAAKAFGLPAEEIKAMANSLPYRFRPAPAAEQPEGEEKTLISEQEVDSPYAVLMRAYRAPLHRAIFQHAAALIGLPHHASIHPGGVVIAPGNLAAPGKLADLVPLQMAAKGVIVTQFDLDSIERMGLVKIDLLGIRGLTVLGDVAEAISGNQATPSQESGVHAASSGQFYPSSLDVLDSIPEDDPGTAHLLRAGKTIGCFQIESPGMRATLKEIQAGSVDDLMVALALYRPGPLTGGLKDAFVRRHRGEEPVSHLHPSLASLLEDTYGVILYQEQVLRIAHELAGLSLEDADLLRRAMSHFDPGKEMQILKQKFLRGAAVKGGVPQEVGERTWELMSAFAGYGFPKAHAASYALVAWRSAWCKVHHPAIFMAAVLANWGGYYPQRIYLNEARRVGLAIRPPHVQWAGREFSVRRIEGQPVLFMGLEQVRDLTRRAQERILSLRPFSSLQDFLSRVDPRPVEAENLVKVGALQGFGTIPDLLRQIGEGGWRGGQLSLFPAGDEQSSKEDWSLEQQVQAQQGLLGAGVSAHPLELLSTEIEAAGAVSTLEAAGRVGEKLRVAGMRFAFHPAHTAAGEKIYFLSLDDLEGLLEVIVPAGVYRRSGSILREDRPLLVEGIVERDRLTGEVVLRAERIEQIRRLR